MLATTLGEWELAERHFEAAMELNRRMGATTWLARTAYEYGRMLIARGEGAERAEALLEQARGAGAPALPERIRALASRAADSALPDGLSPREVQILAQVARGLSNREIGATLHISEHTAANHIRSILRKTGCANRTEAASYAHAHRLITT
jgi:DNA-binding NarL/FixJ family response regulator